MHYVQQDISEFTSHNMTQEVEDWSDNYTYQVDAEEPLLVGDGGAVVRYGNYYYRTIVNNNKGLNPEQYLGTKWVRWGVSNAYAMLDLSAGSKSVFTEDYATTGGSNIKDVSLNDIALIEVQGGSTGTVGAYYIALTTQPAVDIDAEDYTNVTNWELLSELQTTGGTQVVDVYVDDVVWLEVQGTATGTLGAYYRALTEQLTLDIDIEDYTNTTNWAPYTISQDHTATAGTQVVDTAIDDIVWLEVLGTATGTATAYYKALTVQAGIDLNIEDYTNATNWELSSNSMVVEFERNDIDTLVVGNYSATFITVEHLDGNGDVIAGATQIREHSTDDDVTDYYSYIYSAYSKTTGLDLAFKLLEVGVKLRVTFQNTIAGGEVSCGFLVGGTAKDMGDTRIGVNFSFNSYSVRNTDDFGVLSITKRGIQQLVDFETYIDSKSIAKTVQTVKGIYDEVMVFIVDPLENSLYDSIITLGVVDSVSTVLENPVQSVIAWSIQETI